MLFLCQALCQGLSAIFPCRLLCQFHKWKSWGLRGSAACLINIQQLVRNRDGTGCRGLSSSKPTFITTVFYSSKSPTFSTHGLFCGRQFFHGLGWGCLLEWSSSLHLLCTLFYYFYISHFQIIGQWGSWGRGPLLYSPSAGNLLKSVGKEELGPDSCDESVLFPMPSKLLQGGGDHGVHVPLHLRTGVMRQVLDLESGLMEWIPGLR